MRVENRDVLLRILGLFSADELKVLGKQVELKGTSKLAKGELVKAIANLFPEEALLRFIEGEGKAKVRETIMNAAALLGGSPVATERLSSITLADDGVDARFDGMRWTTKCTMRLPSAGAPVFEHECTCKASETGALCVHFWTAFIQLIADGKLPGSAMGPFEGLAHGAVEAALKAATGRQARPLRVSIDAGSKPFDQLLKDWTVDGRYDRAMEELGRSVPAGQGQDGLPEQKVAKPARASGAGKRAPKPGPEQPSSPPGKATRKARKPAAEPFQIQVEFSRLEAGPPASILATLARLTQHGKETLPFRVLIDEKARVLAHDGCMDFDMRLRRKQLLCKHFLQVFSSIDENVARRLLGALGNFTFTNIVPVQKDAPLTLPEAIKRLEPGVRVTDDDELKDSIMTYLLANESFPDKLGIESIRAEMGQRAGLMLRVMVAEGMVEEHSPGHFKPR